MSVKEQATCTKKVRFETKAEAWRELIKIALVDPAERWPMGKPVSAHPCDRCGGRWHLTRRAP